MSSPFQLDHVFLAVSRGGPEMDQLVAAGFAEGPPNSHPGQGTACRRVFFRNAYLELVWLEDPVEAASPIVEPTRLALRTRGRDGASRVGICIQTHSAEGSLPVRTWSYRPPYLPEGASIPVAESSVEAHEPLLFFLPRHDGPRHSEPAHPNGARELTEVVVTLPYERDPSDGLRWLASSGCVRTEAGASESLRVCLDHGAQGQSLRLDTPTSLELIW